MLCCTTISGECRSPTATIPNFAETAGWRFSHAPRSVTPAAAEPSEELRQLVGAVLLAVPRDAAVRDGEVGIEGQVGLQGSHREEARGSVPWLGVASATAVQTTAVTSTRKTINRFIELSDP